MHAKRRVRTLRQLLQLQAPRQRGQAQPSTSATSSTRSPYRLSRHLGHHHSVQVPHLALPSAVFWRHCGCGSGRGEDVSSCAWAQTQEHSMCVAGAASIAFEPRLDCGAAGMRHLRASLHNHQAVTMVLPAVRYMQSSLRTTRRSAAHLVAGFAIVAVVDASSLRKPDDLMAACEHHQACSAGWCNADAGSRMSRARRA